MAKQNVPFLSFNRGLISPKALGRIDLDRTRLSAEVFRNWIAKTQGAMTIRPGTKHFGSSLSDTGAEWIEFVAATDDVALLEITSGTMRIWLGDDPHALALLERPFVDTTLSLSDTGWADTSTGGNATVVEVDYIPVMTAATTSGATMSASSTLAAGAEAYRAGDDDLATEWQAGSAVTQWLKIDFGTARTVLRYTIRARKTGSPSAGNAPNTWTLQGSNDDAAWTTEDSRSGETGWGVSEKRTFTAQNDTGATAWRYWRLNISAINGASSGRPFICEWELINDVGSHQAAFNVNGLTLNPTSIGALARAERHIVVDTGDAGVEHSLAINIARGPVTFRVGSTARDDDYIDETMLGTGYHNLAFTPSTDFYITLQSDVVLDRIITSLDIGDTGTVQIIAPWTANDLDNIRFDQSADVIYADCADIHPAKIERRGTGRSWSVVEYEPDKGPFFSSPSTAAKLSVSHFFGNTTMNSDVPFFKSGHAGALMRIFHESQSGQWKLGALDAKTDSIAVTGISDTGTTPEIGKNSEREVTIAASGTWSGSVVIEKSVDGADVGFRQVPANVMADTGATDTGTFSHTFIDKDDNIKVWYRVKIGSYVSGVAVIDITYKGGGGITGIARITGYNSNTDVDIEVLSRFSDTGTSDNWQEGYWSGAKGFPSAVALHSGRLFHANGGTLFGSVSDDYENFDDTTIGDAAPIIRTLGSGPVDNIYFLLSLIRLVIGTTGAELTLRSSSLDEPVTPSNSAARSFATEGSANLRALKLNSRGIHVQRSRQRISMVGFGSTNVTQGDYEGSELTLLVPDLLKAGVVSIAIQRMPDTRLHCVLADGTVGILTYEPNEEVICWQTWTTEGAVEKAAVLPGVSEDAVYYHTNRTINGVTKRFLEKWAKETECFGDTGLCFIMDCASSFTDTGRSNTLADIAPHLPNTHVILWGDLDTGGTPFIDLSPDTDTGGAQRTYLVDTGGDIALSLTNGLHHAVAGLPYTAAWKSTKLAYGAQLGTALTMKKRVPQIGLALYKTHCSGLFTGYDTGSEAVQPLPRMLNKGAAVDPDQIFATLDEAPFATPGPWDEDSRITLRAKAPRPCTVLAVVGPVDTNES